MEQLLANLSGKVQKRTLHGREYLVAPLSMIVPGVLNGSRGALLYPLDEIGRNSDAWNGMPIVVNHPVVDDKPVSARSPEVLEQFGIGTVYNAVVDGKLAAEGWFDVLRTKQIEPRIYAALLNNTPLELSTGLFTENEKAADGATFNGVQYEFIARNYRPDHLAILPDQKGACSLKDGCGVLINGESKQTIWNKLGQMLGITDNMLIDAEDEKAMEGMTPEQRKKYMADKKAKMMSMNTDGPTSGSSDNPVVKEPDVKLNANERKAIVDDLVANCDCYKGASAEDLKVLNGFSDEQLTRLKDQREKGKQTALTANAATAGIIDKEGNKYTFNAKEGKWDLTPAAPVKKDEPTANGGKEVTTLKPTNDNADERLTAEERTALEFARNQMAQQKGVLIGQLVANSAAKTDAEKQALIKAYGAMEIPTLEVLARNASKPQGYGSAPQLYFGQGGGFPTQTQNTEPELDQEDILVRPTVNWEQESREQRGQDKREALAARN